MSSDPSAPGKPPRKPSLVERASEAFGGTGAFGARPLDVAKLPPDPELPPVVIDAPKPATPTPTVAPPVQVTGEPLPAVVGEPPQPAAEAASPAPRPRAVRPGRQGTLDRGRIASEGLINPAGDVSELAEEIRIVKLELLRGVSGSAGRTRVARGNRVLITSPNSGDGKTFCAANLALSLAAEADRDVVLVDADFPHPSIVARLGLKDGPGLMDLLADSKLSVDECLIQTDLPGLKVLPSGKSSPKGTEWLASARTESVLAQLEAGAPDRIILFDSPPVLAASPASVLAAHVGQTIVVVRADVTGEAAVRESVSLLAGCANIQLLLNGVRFAPGGRRFGSYYRKGK